MIARPKSLPVFLLKNLLVALICLPVGRIGLLFAFENGNVSLVWPLTGVSLAILLLFGWEYLPGIWLGTLASDLMSGTPIIPALGMSLGSALTGIVGAYALQKVIHIHLALDRARDVISFVAFGAFLPPVISATVGVICLSLAGLIPQPNFLLDVVTWWLGDAMGILVVAPIFMIWGTVPIHRPPLRKLVEGATLVALLTLICALVFNQGFGARSFYPLAYLIFPFLVWGALRFNQRAVVSLMLLVSLIAIFETRQQSDSFSRQMIWVSLLFLWAYLATMAITSMLLAAALAERRQIERTVSSLEERFSKAFHAAPVAIWIGTLDDGVFIDVNEEYCTLMGYTHDEMIGKKSLDLNIWDYPDARAQMIALLRQQGHIPQIQGRMRSKSGEMRDGLISLELIELEGEPRLLGMFHDLTARLQAEAALRQSESHYRELFEGVDDAIFVHDLEANILDVNEATVRRLGYSREELLRMKITDLDAHGFASGFQERLKTQLEQGHLSQIEGIRSARDGREIFIDINTKLITYRGQPAIFAVDRDITERKRAEQQLRESETRYRAIVEDQTEMISRVSLDWKMNFVNDAFCRYYGKPREELIGTLFNPNIHDEDLPQTRDAIKSLTAENPVITSEHRVVLPDDSLRWHQLTSRAITGQDGQIIEYQFVIKDITESKEMEKQRIAVALEHEKVQILADFIAAASHDFRTPLSVINTSAYLLKRVEDKPQQEHHFRQIQEQTHNIERLVEGLLTMSRLDRGDVFRFKSVQLNSVIQQIEVRKRGQVDQRQISLSLDLDPHLPPIDADEGWIYQCIVQLVDNAIQYTADGGAITIRTAAEPDQIVLEVVDTGVGISPDDLPHIFKRLYRGEGHRPVGGQGLGLSIAAKIVEAHQGRIEVESQPAAGSTFRVLLPLKRSDMTVEPAPVL